MTRPLRRRRHAKSRSHGRTSGLREVPASELPVSQPGFMASRRRLPRGWSHPLKPGEIAALLPGLGSVSWNGRPQDWQAPLPPGIPARVESAIDDAATRTDRVGRAVAGPRGYTSVDQRHSDDLDARMAAGGGDGPADMAGRGAQHRMELARDGPIAIWLRSWPDINDRKASACRTRTSASLTQATTAQSRRQIFGNLKLFEPKTTCPRVLRRQMHDSRPSVDLRHVEREHCVTVRL